MAEWNLKYEFSNMIDGDILEMIDFVNIGGGLPSVYANTNEDVIKSIFDKTFLENTKVLLWCSFRYEAGNDELTLENIIL